MTCGSGASPAASCPDLGIFRTARRFEQGERTCMWRPPPEEIFVARLGILGAGMIGSTLAKLWRAVWPGSTCRPAAFDDRSITGADLRSPAVLRSSRK